MLRCVLANIEWSAGLIRWESCSIESGDRDSPAWGVKRNIWDCTWTGDGVIMSDSAGIMGYVMRGKDGQVRVESGDDTRFWGMRKRKTILVI